MPSPIVIAPYDARWPERFRELAAPMRRALGDAALRIDHIGSTAVPGLDAKPVIDIQISVAGLEPLAAYRAPLESLGYVFQADNEDRTKRYFREPPGTPRTHVHVRRAGGWPEQLALLFRDYLRASSGDARRYAAVKRELAARFGDDREGYTEGKGPVVWELLQAANSWTQRTGWQPGPSDA
jgi:GrpB-like predicted nucleotidyltransferase (UPF0157 family)